MSDDNKEVKLSDSTIATFKKLSSINQSLKLVADSDVLKSKAENSTMVCFAPVEDSFPRDFNIYDLREFISVLGIVEDPTLDFSNDKFVIVRSADNKQRLRYLESDATFVASSYTENEPQVPGIAFEVTVTEQQFKSMINAAQTLGLEYAGFIGDGENVELTAFNRNQGPSDQETNKFSVEVGESDTDSEFRMYYKLEHHNIAVLLGEGELKFEVSDRKISKVSTETGKTFWITMDAKSEFDGS